MVAGAGLMGRWHADAAVRCGGRIAAVVDRDLERARMLAGAYRPAEAVARLDDALRDGCDVVHVCTPLSTHEEIVRSALEAGCHVLCEKPLAPTAASTRELLEAATARERILCPVHQLPFQRGVLGARERLARIAPLRHFDFVACTAGAEHLPPAQRRRVLEEILPHPLSLLETFVSARIDRASWHTEAVGPGELRTWANLDGIGVSLLLSSAGRPTRHQATLTGERGSIHLDLFHGFHVIEAGRVSRPAKILRPFRLSAATAAAATANLTARALRREPAYPGLRELIRRLYAAVDSGGLPPVSPEATLAEARAREAILGRA